MLYVDHGSDFTSHHLDQVAASLRFRVAYSAIGRTQGRGKVERLFGTLNTELLPELPGYLAGSRPATPPHDIAGWDPSVHWIGDEQIAMLMYPGMTVMDLIGPHSMFAGMMGAPIHLVARSLDPVTSDAGVTITPTATFETCPKDLTVLFTPGGAEGMIKAATRSGDACLHGRSG